MLSVIVPFWNAGIYVTAALKSIAKQGVPVHEVLVMDQGAETPELAFPEHLQAQYPWLKRISSSRGTPAHIRNEALAKVTGNVVAFLDDDDLWPEGKLRRQLPLLESHEVVGGLVRMFPDGQPADDDRIAGKAMFNVGAYIYRREVLEQLGGFNCDYLHGEDVDLWYRASARKLIVLRTIELYYRQRRGTLTDDGHSTQKGYEKATLSAVKRSLVSGKPVRSVASFIDNCEL